MGKVVHQVTLQTVCAFGALDGKQRVSETSGNEKHHHDAQGESAQHLAYEVAAEFGKMHPELQGAQSHRIALGQKGFVERLGLLE